MNEKELKKILYHHAINTTDVLGDDCMAIYDDVFDFLIAAIMDKVKEDKKPVSFNSNWNEDIDR